jgi:hypothetical protein
MYAAAGFDLVREEKANGDSWQSREERQAVNDFTRRKWVYELREE